MTAMYVRVYMTQDLHDTIQIYLSNPIIRWLQETFIVLSRHN